MTCARTERKVKRDERLWYPLNITQKRTLCTFAGHFIFEILCFIRHQLEGTMCSENKWWKVIAVKKKNVRKYRARTCVTFRHIFSVKCAFNSLSFKSICMEGWVNVRICCFVFARTDATSSSLMSFRYWQAVQDTLNVVHYPDLTLTSSSYRKFGLPWVFFLFFYSYYTFICRSFVFRIPIVRSLFWLLYNRTYIESLLVIRT